MIVRFVRGLGLVALLCSNGGCDRSGPPAYDLVEAFPLADTEAEQPVLDLGTKEARDRLVSGWGHDERTEQITFVWGIGDQSELRWYLSRPMDVAMFLRGLPYTEGNRTQKVTVVVNDQPVGEITLAKDLRGYVLQVHRASFVAGWNRIVLRYAFHRDSDSAGTRPVAVAWDFIELRHRRLLYELPHLTKVGDAPALVLPPGSQIDYFLPLPADARLEIERIVWPDGTQAKPEDAAFEVELRAEGAPPRVFSGLRAFGCGAMAHAARSHGGRARAFLATASQQQPG